MKPTLPIISAPETCIRPLTVARIVPFSANARGWHPYSLRMRGDMTCGKRQTAPCPSRDSVMRRDARLSVGPTGKLTMLVTLLKPMSCKGLADNALGLAAPQSSRFFRVFFEDAGYDISSLFASARNSNHARGTRCAPLIVALLRCHRESRHINKDAAPPPLGAPPGGVGGFFSQSHLNAPSWGPTALAASEIILSVLHNQAPLVIPMSRRA